MNRPRNLEPYLLGGDPPVWVVPADLVALLDRVALNSLRLAQRGDGATRLNDCLLAAHFAALTFIEHQRTSNPGNGCGCLHAHAGNLETPPDDDMQLSGRERMGTAEAAGVTGYTRRRINDLAPELGGRKIRGSWSLDRRLVEALASRRAAQRDDGGSE